MKRKSYEDPEPIHIDALPAYGHTGPAFDILPRDLYEGLNDTLAHDWLAWQGFHIPARILLDLAHLWRDEPHCIRATLDPAVPVLHLQSGQTAEGKFVSLTEIRLKPIKTDLPEWREGRPSWADGKDVFIPLSLGYREDAPASSAPKVDPWLAKALCKDEARPSLCQSWGDFCTDGTRAHIDQRLAPVIPPVTLDWDEAARKNTRETMGKLLESGRALDAIALVDVKALTRAAKLAKIGNKSTIRLAFNGVLGCHGTDGYDETGCNVIKSYEYSGPDREILIDPRYLLDALSGLAGQVVIGVPFVPEDKGRPEAPVYLSDGAREALIMPKFA